MSSFLKKVEAEQSKSASILPFAEAAAVVEEDEDASMEEEKDAIAE